MAARLLVALAGMSACMAAPLCAAAAAMARPSVGALSAAGGGGAAGAVRLFRSAALALAKHSDDKKTLISWYPGHIAKAERELADYLKKVDVVVEVVDARIPFSTTHPMVPTWVGKKPLVVAVARLDQVSSHALREWKAYFARNPVHPERPDAPVFFVNGKLGAGVAALKRHALRAGEAINERRERRGIQPRAVRAAVIGFPNVGKSALINRLLGRRVAQSRNLPGVTRSMQWARLGGLRGSQEHHIELLDSPGIIPARQFDQESALRLAICNDIGEASYDRVVVAAAMVDQLLALNRARSGYVCVDKLLQRYGLSSADMSGEALVYGLADRRYRGNLIAAADTLLSDFRKNMLDFGSLEAPPLGAFDVRASAEADVPDLGDKSWLEDGEAIGDAHAEAPTESVRGTGVVSELQVESAPLPAGEAGRGRFDGW